MSLAATPESTTAAAIIAYSSQPVSSSLQMLTLLQHSTTESMISQPQSPPSAYKFHLNSLTKLDSTDIVNSGELSPIEWS